MTHNGLHPYINGYPLTEIGAFGEVSYSENWLHGCEEAGWSMAARHRRNTRLHPGARVVIKMGATPCWSGYLAEPGRDGTFKANGLWRLGDGVLALDGASAPTNVPQTGVAAAITRTAVPWTQPAAISATAVGEATAGRTVVGLLDDYSATATGQWRVDHTGQVVVAEPPTTPRWGVIGDGNVWSTSVENYLTHLNVTYMAGVGSFPSFVRTTTESLAAAARFGPQEDNLDLTGFGIITLGTAQGYADAILAKTGPRMVLTEPFRFVPGQLRTLGDTPAGWSGVHAGQALRVWGLIDRTRINPMPYSDVPIGHLERTSSTLTLTPQGAPPRNVRDVIAALVA